MKALEGIEEALRAALRFGILAALSAGPACGGETKRSHSESGEGGGMAGAEAGNGSGGSAGSDRGGSAGSDLGGVAGNQNSGNAGASIGGTASGVGSGGSTVASGGMGTAGVSAGNTSGGFAGAPPIELTDPELCEAACTELDDSFEVPGALCEDWRVLDDKYELAFCGKTEATGCSARCTERLSRVPEACHDALRAGIPCVASDSFYKGVSAQLCYLQKCYPQLYRISAECNGLREELAAARARWNGTVGEGDYSFWFGSEPMSVKIEVTAGVPTVIEGTLASPPTIEDLFARVERQLDEGLPLRLVEYDETFGYPFHAESLRLGACGDLVSYGFAVSELEVRPK
jgi:hypothetical protein